MNNITKSEACTPSQPDTLQALEDLARAINYTQENVVRLAGNCQSVVGHYEQAPSIDNSFDVLQGSIGITNAIYNMASQVRKLNEQVNQQADILGHQFGSSTYFQTNNVEVPKTYRG